VHVVVALENDGINVYGVNDTPDAISAELTAGFFDMDHLGRAEASEVLLPANASTLLRTLGGKPADPTRQIAFASLLHSGGRVTRSRLVLPRFRELCWAPSNLTVREEDGDAVFESETFVWGVCLDLDGDLALPDNFFDVWPDVPFRVPWSGSEPPRILRVGNLCEAKAVSDTPG
jgi:hypothetical protein